MTDVEEKRQKRVRAEERREYYKILRSLDYQDQRDLASHLLLAMQYRRKQRPSKRTKNQQAEPQLDNAMIIQDTWTAWPLPSNLVHRPIPIYSSSNKRQHPSSALRAEIEATMLRITRSRIQSDDPSLVSADELPPYQLTREVTSHVITKFDRLLHALGRIKYQHLKSSRAKNRLLKSGWDEIVGIAGISKCIDSSETMKRVTKRCNRLFDEDISLEAEQNIGA
jgi:RNA polymerase I specific transcription initiation factor